MVLASIISFVGTIAFLIYPPLSLFVLLIGLCILSLAAKGTHQ